MTIVYTPPPVTSITIPGNVEVVNDVGNPLPISGTVEVNNDVGNTLPVLDSAVAAVVLTEDTASVTGDKGIQTLTKRSDTAATTSDADGDYQPLITDKNGRLYVRSAEVSGQILLEDGTVATVKRAFANVAQSQTDSSIVPSVSSKKIRVLAVVGLTGGTATNLTFNSKGGGAGNAISPLLANGVNGGEILSYLRHGWFETASGEALTVTTGAGATTGILVIYIEA